MKNIQVKLTFTSDTTAAKAQIQSLQQQLNNLAVASQNQPFGMTKNLQEAQQAALSLKVAIQNATNVDTGKLNLGKFRQQIKKSGIDLQQYATRLQRLGPEGTKAFNQMAIAIAQAERPAFSLSTSLGKLGQTFLNTARWTIASSIITGIMSSFRSIVDYTKEFDQALNNIRIVTGKNQEQMERFAQTANEAAKALKTTAKEYAEASLIYFQQGLSTKEVLERTEVTVKLAKVVGESAETVSEWMTAIWNNFDDGSETLVHYADVLAELGAATASSADEIATGLEKFSAVADTIGLSYEYAASALATVTAETRQSADVVGTALKTIFSRMEGLKLGEALDDGTTLNQYSQALATIGVDIKDATGALKDMDIILAETGAKWKTLSRDEQVALAQGVAGIRQYSQFMALMDNYDIMEKNVKRSKEAIGALEQQFEIYGSGVEASSAQMQNALDSLKSKFLSGDALADIYKVFAEIVEFAGDLVDALGGLPGILTIAANLMLKAFGPSMLAGIQQLSATFNNTFGTKKADAFVDQALTTAAGMNMAGAGGTQEATIESSYLKEQGQYQRELFQLKDSISATDKEILNMESQILTKMKDQAIEAAKIAQEKEASAREAADDLSDEIGTNEGKMAVERLESRSTMLGKMDARAESLTSNADYASTATIDSQEDRNLIADRMVKDIDAQVADAKTIYDQDLKTNRRLATKLANTEDIINSPNTSDDAKIQAMYDKEAIEKEIKDLDFESTKKGFEDLEASADDAKKSIDGFRKGTGQLDDATKDAIKTTNKAAKSFGEKGVARSLNQVKKEAEKAGKTIKDLDKKTDTISKDFREYGKQTTKATTLTNRLTTGFENLRKRMHNLSGVKIGQFFSGLASTTMNAAMAVQMLGNGFHQLGQAIDEGDWSGIVSSLMSISMGVMSTISVLSSLKKGIDNVRMSRQKNIQVQNQEQIENTESTITEVAEGEAIEETGEEIEEKTAAETADVAIENVDTGTDITSAAAENLEQKEIDETTKKTNKGFLAKLKDTLISIPQNLSNYATWPAAFATIAGLALAGIAVGAIAISNNESKKEDDEKQREALEKEREAAKENIQQTEETINKNGELVNSYYDLVDTYEQTGKGMEDLIAKGKELAETYDDESIRIAALAGDYDTLTEAIRKARVAELEEQEGSITADTITLGEAVVDAAKENLGFSVSDARAENDSDKINIASKAEKVFSTNLSNGYVAQAKAGDGTTDETVMYDAIQSVNSPYIKKADDGSVYLGLENMTAAELQAAYDDVTEILTTAKNIDPDAIGDSEIAKELTSWRSKLKESMENYEQAAALDRRRKVETKVLSTKSKKGQYVSAIDTQAEYDLYRDEIKAGLTEEEWEDAKDVLMENAGKFEERSQLTETFNNANQSVGNQVKQYIADADDITVKALSLIASDEELFAKVTNGLISLDAAIASQTEKAAELTAQSAFEEAGYTATDADTYIALLEGYNDKLREIPGLGEEAALAILNLNKGVEELSKAWENQSNILLTAKKDTLEYALGITEVANAIGKMLSVDMDTYGWQVRNFVDSNANLVNQLMLGDMDALSIIQTKVGTAMAKENDMENEFSDIIKHFYDTDYSLGQEVSQDIITSMTSDISQAMQKWADTDGKEGISVGQVTEMFKTLGFQVDIVNNKIQGLRRITDEDFINASLTKSLKEREKSNKKILEDEIDRYHTINEELDDINNKLDELSAREERAFGASSLEFAKEGIKATEDLIEKTKQYNAEIEKDLQNDKNKILKYGFSFDEDGRISNYEKVREARLNEFNRKGAALGWQGEEFDALKDEYDKFIEEMEQYEETLNLSETERLNLMNLEFDLESQKLGLITKEADKAAEMREDQLSYIEHMLELLDDPAWDAAEKISRLTDKASQNKAAGGQARKNLRDTLAFNNTFTEEEINALMNGEEIDLSGKELTKEQAESIRRFRDELYEENLTWKEISDTIQDNVVESLSSFNEQLTKNTEKLEHSKSVLESYRNIVDIVGKDTLGLSNEILDQMGQSNVKMAQQSVGSNRAIYEFNKNAYEEAKKLYEEGGLSKERLDEIENTMLESEQAFMDSWSSALEAAATEFESSVERIMEAYDSAMGNLSEKSEWFEKQQTLQDFFLKDYEKTYEISKLNRQISQSIDSNDSVAAQRKLRDIQSELLDYQKQGKNMSDYDLQYLQKKYDLTMAQNALEDAQNAKSQARLTRDSSGNFGYVYTANQKNIESAQQQYEDKLYAMEQFLDQSQNDLSKQWFELNQQWADEMAALDKNAQDYEQKAADITAYYTELMTNVSGEMTDMVQYGMEINQEYGTHAAETFNETILGKMYTDYSNFQELQATATEAMQTSLNNIISKHSEFKANVETTMVAAGTSVEDFKDDYTTWMGEAEKANSSLVKDTQDLATEMETAYNEVLKKAQTFNEQYGGKIKGIIDTNNSIAESMNKVLWYYSKATGKDFTTWVEEQNKKTTTNSETGDPNNDSFNSGNTSFTPSANARKGEYYVLGQRNDLSGESYTKLTQEGSGVNYYVKTSQLDSDSTRVTADGTYTKVSPMADSWMTEDEWKTHTSKSPETVTVQKIQSLTNGKTYYQLSDNNWYRPNQLPKQGNTEINEIIPISSIQGYRGNKFPNTFEDIIADDIFYIPLKNISLEHKNADYIARYGEEGNYIDSQYFTKLKDGYTSNEIDGYNRESKLYHLKNPLYLIANEWDTDTDTSQEISYYTHWLNQIDLNQLLGSEKTTALYQQYGLKLFDTGGYTGSWGPEGRMAMLHQKEIVLNAHDTENLLTVVEIVRSITDKLNNNILLASQGLGGLVTAAAVTNNREVLEQNVTIHAEFPNATDHNEIELAFNDLINQASQYVNRR